MGQVAPEVLRELEVEAYSSVMRALYAGTYDLEKEELLTKLRAHLHVDHSTHSEVLASVKEDLQALKEGRELPSRARRSAQVRNATMQSEGSLAAAQSAGGAPRRPAARVGTSGSQRSRPAASQKRASRPAAVRSSDPYNYVGRRVWRRWPSEELEWVEGIVYEYDPEAGTHSILYDANVPERETVEDGFSFSYANEGDYVLGDFVDLKTFNGSRRQAEYPVEAPAEPPADPASVAASLAASRDGNSRPPSKKRRSSAPAVPQTAPFETAWFASRVTVAGEAELASMLQVLDRKELEKEAELRLVEEDLATAGDEARRAELDREFAALCEREDFIMRELAQLCKVEA